MGFAWRQLRRSPGFALTAIVSLALGIGANTAMFTLADALLFRPLAVRHPEQLVRLQMRDRRGRALPLESTLVEQLRRDGISGGLCAFLTPLSTVEMNGRLTQLSALALSGDCFDTLGLHPAVGRFFDVAGDGRQQPKVVVLAYDTWQAEFGGRAGAIGKTIEIEGDPFTIIGVMEPHFTGLLVGFSARLFFPSNQLSALEEEAAFRVSYPEDGIVRLRDDETIGQLTAHLRTLWPELVANSLPSRLSDSERAAYLASEPLLTSAAAGIDYSLRGRFERPLLALLGIAALVLLVACVNVANLLLARGVQRRAEVAVRLALGAGRRHIAGQMLAESALLLLAGAAAAMPLAYWVDELLVSMFHVTSPTFAISLAPDRRALLFTAAIAAAAFAIFAVLPAWKSIDIDAAAFGSASPRVAGDRHPLRKLVIGTQVALTIVLVALGALCIAALTALRHAPLGFAADHVLMAPLSPLPGGYTPPFAARPYYQALLERVEAVPGVLSAALSNVVALTPAQRFQDVAVSGSSGTVVQAEEIVVTDGFLKTMGIPLAAGADFSRADGAAGERTVMISESLSRELFGRESAIGRHIRAGGNPRTQSLRVAGVVRDAVLTRPQARNTLVVYESYWDSTSTYPTMVIRTEGESSAIAEGIRRELRAGGREFPRRLLTLADARDISLAQESLLAMMAGVFAAVGLTLAAIGLYGLLSFFVAGRTSEIGVRMALGARQGQVMSLVMREAAALVMLGVLIGAPMAWASSCVAQRVLFGGSRLLAGSIAGAVLLLAIVAFVAAWIPAHRAASVDPAQGLREG